MIPYRLGFEILNDALSACKQAMNYEAVASKHWRELAALTTWREETPGTHRGFRLSGRLPNVLECNVAYENQLVRLEFIPREGSEILFAKIHFSDMFKIYRAGRIACRTAKAWAGDASRIWGGSANLRTAEENDKLRVE